MTSGKPFSLVTLGITTFSITTQLKGLVYDTQYNNALHFAECCFAECRVLFTVMLSVIMLNVVMLSVVILSVVAPRFSVVPSILSKILNIKGDPLLEVCCSKLCNPFTFLLYAIIPVCQLLMIPKFTP